MAATKRVNKAKKAENETKGRRWGQDPHYPRRVIDGAGAKELTKVNAGSHLGAPLCHSGAMICQHESQAHGEGHSRHHRSSSPGCRKHSCLLSLESPTPRQTTRDGTPQGYFHGDIDARQFARRVRESGDYGFTGGAEFYALVTGAFQRAADAQLAHHSHTKEVESKLLRSLAALKAEFGLPDCYRIEPWRPGRE